MIGSVLCYKVPYKGMKLLKEVLKKEDIKADITVVEDLSKLNLIDFEKEDFDSIFIQLDEGLDSSWIQSFLKKTNPEVVNVILKNKSFENLLLCQRYQVNYVFDGEVPLASLKAAIARNVIIRSSQYSELPANEIMSLFSLPIKIKNNEELFGRLDQYFSKFSDVKKIGLLKLGEEEEEEFGFSFPKEVRRKLEGIKDLERHYVGYEIELVIGENENLIATAVYQEDGIYTWLILEVNKKKKSYILNDHVFRFLQNSLIYRKNKEKEKRLEQLAVTDEVTGLFNQRKLSEDLEEAVKVHEEIHERFSIMFVDVDHFKKVNDNYGHLVGSKLLIDIGNALKMILRDSDDVYRYGGDEFVVIMPNVDIGIVHSIAGRVSEKVKDIDFDIGEGRTHKLSLSIGIAEYPTDANSASKIIQFADEMMYVSKKSGRGKVFHVKEVRNADSSSK